MTDFVLQDFAHSPAIWVAAHLLALAGGYFAGIIHFRSLRIVTRRLMAGDWTAVVLQFARLVGLGAMLWLFAQWDAYALLAAAAGIVMGRGRVLSRVETLQ
jgi:N-ATPase, AtpR subunit